MDGELHRWFATHVETNRLAPLAITRNHCAHLAELPLRHRHPWDRLLLAQAQTKGLVLIGDDRKFGAYDVEVTGLRS